ncbi:MAG: FecR domain-containing protein [Pseudomonadota bacterium]|nr:FecR domain-containing protein [Pseudomonadota bacterium]
MLAVAAIWSLQMTLAGPAAAQEKLGEAVVIRNNVTGQPPQGATRQIAVSDPVHGAELISADAASHGELQLNDGSLVIVGENSSISLDDFVVSGNSFSAATLNVAKGAFRFISGESPKQAFRIQTPLSSIGVRGTVFDVYVDPADGNTKVVLLSGAVRVCTRGQVCVNAARACDIVEVRSETEIGRIPFLRSRERGRREEAEQFTLTEQQNRFQRRWRAPMLACRSRAALEALPGGSQTGAGDVDVPSNEGNDDKGDYD